MRRGPQPDANHCCYAGEGNKLTSLKEDQATVRNHRLRAVCEEPLVLIKTQLDAQVLAVLNYIAAKPPLNRSVFD